MDFLIELSDRVESVIGAFVDASWSMAFGLLFVFGIGLRFPDIPASLLLVVVTVLTFAVLRAISSHHRVPSAFEAFSRPNN